VAVDQRRGTGGIRRLAWLLDDFIRVPGTNLRFGLDPLLGLIPGGGDIAGGMFSGYIILTAWRAGAPASVILRMGANVIADLVVGTVPLLGDLFDAGFKANRRNAALLDQYMGSPAPVEKRSRLVILFVLLGLALAVVSAAVLSVMLVRWIFSLF
jgi:hypothetical protein